MYVIPNYIHNTEDSGVHSLGTGHIIVDNVFSTNGAHGVLLNNQDFNHVVGNTIYNSSGDNINSNNAGSDAHFIVNNLLDTNGSYNIDVTSGSTFLVYGYNNLINHTTGASNNVTITQDLGGGQTESGMNTTTFQPPAALDDLGYPVYYDANSGGTTIVGHKEMGAIPYEETGGSAATTGYTFVQ